MIKKIEHISGVSVLDQFGVNDVLSLSKLEYDNSQIQSGGFGNIFPIISIDESKANNLLVKVYWKKEAELHGYDTIKLLHGKLKEQQNVWGMTSMQKYPELIGIPFLAFHGQDENGESLVAFVMYDLNKFDYSDLGDGNVRAGEILEKLDLIDKVYLAYRLTSIVELFHNIGYVHSDLKHESLFVNSSRCQLAIIDYDSGYHVQIQRKPSVLGALTRWAGVTARRLIKGLVSQEQLTDEERISDENWILGKAVFELLYGTDPYFYLVDNDDNTIVEYAKRNKWPAISENSDLASPVNLKGYPKFLELFSLYSKKGLANINVAFVQLFNDGIEKYRERPTASKWKALLYEINATAETTPSIIQFESDKLEIRRINEPITFTWKVKYANQIYLNSKQVLGIEDYHTLNAVDGGKFILTAENDFGQRNREIEIVAQKYDPQILSFSTSISKRTDLTQVILSWATHYSDRVTIAGVVGEHAASGSIAVDPREKTTYKLIAHGYFNEEVTNEIEVDVSAPQIEYFRYDINIEKGIDNIDLSWKVVDATTVTIEPRVGNVGVTGSTSIGIFEPTEFEIHATGLFGESRKKILTKPFPMPIIRELLVPMPLIKLEYEFDSRSLEIPSILMCNNGITFNSSANITAISPLQVHTSLPQFTALKSIKVAGPKRLGWFDQILDKIQSLAKSNKA